MKIKEFGFEIKEVGEAGTFSGYGSTFGGQPDAYGEVVAPGAFSKTLAQAEKDGVMPFMLWQHDPWQPIGVWEKMEEDKKGLKVSGRLLLDINQGREAHILLREKAIRGLSIGYREKKVEEADVEKKKPRTLVELDLIEVSVVTRPANRRATVTAVKTDDEAIEQWNRLQTIARKFRDQEPAAPSELEKLLRDAGFPKSQACAIISIGYKNAIRSDSGKSVLDKVRDDVQKSIDDINKTVGGLVLPKL